MKRVLGVLVALVFLWALLPVLWLLLSFPALSRQEPDARQLFASVPRTIFGPAEISPTEVSHTGQQRRVLSSGWWNGRDIFSELKKDGWNEVNQFGAVRIYHRRGEELAASCRRFSAFFDVCNVGILSLSPKP